MSTTTRVTYEQFEVMGRRGDFDATEDRYELLLGEIIKMTWPQPPHVFIVDELAEWSFESLPRRAVRISIQQPLGIPALESLTLPDIAWLRRLDYSERRPLPGDVLLIIEVAHTTLTTDRSKKGKIYASAGIADYWIVNVKGRCVEVRRDPQGDEYQTIETYRPDQELRPLAFPEAVLPVGRLFPR